MKTPTVLLLSAVLLIAAGCGKTDDYEAETGNGSENYTPSDTDTSDSEDETPAVLGSAELPYSVEDALKLINNGTADTLSHSVYVWGVVSEIENINTTRGDANYYISYYGSASDSQLYVYRGYNLGFFEFTSKDQLKSGDEVVIIGSLGLQDGIPTIKRWNYLYSVNGETATEFNEYGLTDWDGTAFSPYTVSQVKELYDSNYSYWSGVDNYVCGIVSLMKECGEYSTKNSFFISDDGSLDSTQLLLYQCQNGDDLRDFNDLSVRDTVVVRAAQPFYYPFYYNDIEYSCLEMSNGTVYSWNKYVGDEEDEADGGGND